jgi:hypothetical protein
VEPVLYAFRAASLPRWSLGYWATYGAAAGKQAVKTKRGLRSKIIKLQCSWITDKNGIADQII